MAGPAHPSYTRCSRGCGSTSWPGPSTDASPWPTYPPPPGTASAVPASTPSGSWASGSGAPWARRSPAPNAVDARGPRRGPARRHRRRRGRLGVLHPRLSRRSAPRRGRGARRRARRAGRPGRAAGARLRTEPRRARPPVDQGSPRAVRRGHRGRPRPRPGQLPAHRGGIYACGRDPYFPAWPDVVQLDTSVAATREAAVATVPSIAERADGVRCDMAMLMLDDVFVRTWGDRAEGGPSPDGGRGYWPTVIEAVRRDHPDFVFWAEAYWDLEPVLVRRASTPATTSGSTTGSCTARARPRCGTTSGPIPTTNGTPCASSRTTTSRGRRRCSIPPTAGRRPRSP